MIVIRRKGGCASDQGQKPEEKDGGNHACVKMCPVQSEVSKSGSCPACTCTLGTGIGEFEY